MPSIVFVLSSCLLLFNFMVNEATGREQKTNLLIHESSPYLLKHATNPVDWHPWGDEAFQLAQEEDKPILLSIGYLTCHWCNVMEKESFSDPAVGSLINEIFIPVKVDREERPDIDQIYMKACQLLSTSCGWPLTLFLSPGGKPFYAATYIPRENRFGRLGLLELLPRVRELWALERDSILKSADSVHAAMISATIQLPGSEINDSMLDHAFKAFSENFDSSHGGFGSGPKFPKPLNLLFLLRYWHRSGNDHGLAMAEKTLAAMRRGGIYDHLGFGFHRYTTDRMWRIPHFEKMLYDQALLALVYLEAYQATGRQEFARTSREILDYVLQNLTSPEGGFYSAESADSEGEEGKFYLWQAEELKNILSSDEASVAKRIFHISPDGNYVDPVKGMKTGSNILFSTEDVREVGEYEAIRQKMLKARAVRPRPERDDKVLTDWNGLMIVALAKAAQVLGEPEYGSAAQGTARFILRNLRKDQDGLLHRWRNGQAGVAATAADYSFLTWGLLELYSWDFDTRWLQQALKFTDHLIKNYWDDKLGGFFLTESGPESFLPRIKETNDTAQPSSNGVAMLNLLKLGRLTGNHQFEEKAGAIRLLLSSDLKDSPLAYPMLLSASAFALAPSQEVVIVGRRDSSDTKALLQVLRQNYFPSVAVLFKPAAEQNPAISSYAPFAEFMSALNDKATAYVCTNFTCNFPTNDPAVMLNSLRKIQKKSAATRVGQ